MANKMKHWKLTIELQSDMCCGTGIGDGVRFDTVSAYNDYGLPYIPAKRLKGLLREQAELLCACAPDTYTDEAIKNLFGTGEQAGTLIISNAEIKNAKELEDELAILFKSERERFNAIAVREVYTVARHATAIEEGVAKDKSLRTVGAVPKGVVFQSDLYISDNTNNESNPPNNVTELVEKSTKLLRHIGLNRTRGYGEVICSIEQIGESDDSSQSISNDEESIPTENGEATANETNEKIRKKYTLRLLTDLVSEKDYIAGTAIQGWFAGQLAREKYDDITGFLQTTLFSNAYPTVNECLYYPMPLSCISKKNEDIIYSEVDGYQRESEESIQYVKNSGFAYFDGKEHTYQKYPVQKAVSYHVTTKGQNDVFTLPLLKAGQSFSGIIETNQETWTLLEKRIHANSLIRLGKSINSQFGKCSLTFNEINTTDKEPSSTESEESKEYVVTLRSDAVLYDEYGRNSVTKETLENQVLELFVGSTTDKKVVATFLGTTVTGGYNSKWKMPRRRFHAFVKGTQIRVEAKGICGDREGFIGLFQQEGFGQYSIKEVDEYLYKKDFKFQNEPNTPSTEEKQLNAPSNKGPILELKLNVHKNAIFRKLEKAAYEHFSRDTTDLAKISSSSMLRLNGLYQEHYNKDTQYNDLTNELKDYYEKGSEKRVCEGIIEKFEKQLSNGKELEKIRTILEQLGKVEVEVEKIKTQFFLHYFQYILTAMKLWYKEKKHE